MRRGMSACRYLRNHQLIRVDLSRMHAIMYSFFRRTVELSNQCHTSERSLEAANNRVNHAQNSIGQLQGKSLCVAS